MSSISRREVLATAGVSSLFLTGGCPTTGETEGRGIGFLLELDSIEDATPDSENVIDVDSMDISAEARSIFERAHSGYSASEPYSDAEREVLELLDVPVRQSTKWDERRVRLDGRYYLATVNWSIA